MRLDRAQIQDLIALDQEGAPGVLAELVDLFVADSAQRLAVLRDAAAHGDADRLEAEAHRLRGSALMVGARRVADVCADLERLSHGVAPGAASRLLATLEAEINLVRPELEALARASGRGSPGAPGV